MTAPETDKAMPQEIWVKGTTAYLSDCSVSQCDIAANTVVLAKDDPKCTRYVRAPRPTTERGEADACQQDPMLLEVLNFIELARSLKVLIHGKRDEETERKQLEVEADALYKKLDAIKWGAHPQPSAQTKKALELFENDTRTFFGDDEIIAESVYEIAISGKAVIALYGALQKGGAE